MQINDRYQHNIGRPMNFPPVNPNPEKPKMSTPKKILMWVGIAFAVLFVIGLVGSIVDPPEKTDTKAAAESSAVAEPAAEEAASPSAEQVEAPAAESATPEEPPAPAAPPAVPSVVDAIKKASPEATVSEADGQVNVSFPISDNFTKGLRITGAKTDTLDIIKAAKESSYSGTVYIEGTFPMVDVYGNESVDPILFLTYSPETIAKIQPDTMQYDRIWDAADTAAMHPELRK